MDRNTKTTFVLYIRSKTSFTTAIWLLVFYSILSLLHKPQVMKHSKFNVLYHCKIFWSSCISRTLHSSMQLDKNEHKSKNSRLGDPKFLPYLCSYLVRTRFYVHSVQSLETGAWSHTHLTFSLFLSLSPLLSLPQRSDWTEACESSQVQPFGTRPSSFQRSPTSAAKVLSPIPLELRATRGSSYHYCHKRRRDRGHMKPRAIRTIVN